MISINETRLTIESLVRTFVWGLVAIVIASFIANYLLPLQYLFKIILVSISLLSCIVVYSLYQIATHAVILAAQKSRENEYLTNELMNKYVSDTDI